MAMTNSPFASRDYAPTDEKTQIHNNAMEHERERVSVERVSVASDGTEANGFSSAPSISGDGRYVTYVSGASNLVPDDTNGTFDIFVYDRKTDTTERVSVATDGSQANGDSFGPAISG